MGARQKTWLWNILLCRRKNISGKLERRSVKTRGLRHDECKQSQYNKQEKSD